MATREDWDAKFGTGLRSQYDFTIHAASFGTDMAYNNGQTYLLILTGEDEDGQPSNEMLSLGDGWESTDGGFTVHHEKKAIVNKSSVYGRWCSFAGLAEGSEWLFDKEPTDASIWLNTSWHLEERVVGEAFVARDGSQVPARTRLMPVAFLGFTAEAGISSPAASNGATPASATPEASTAPTGGSPALGLQLQLLAKKSKDYDTFLTSSIALDNLASDAKLAESVMDSGPDGFYAKNH